MVELISPSSLCNEPLPPKTTVLVTLPIEGSGQTEGEGGVKGGGRRKEGWRGRRRQNSELTFRPVTKGQGRGFHRR
jgi:hypothetical protein